MQPIIVEAERFLDGFSICLERKLQVGSVVFEMVLFVWLDPSLRFAVGLRHSGWWAVTPFTCSSPEGESPLWTAAAAAAPSRMCWLPRPPSPPPHAHQQPVKP